jgi:hypothetical protein
VIAVHILVQTQAGKAAVAAAAPRGSPGAAGTAGMAGPYDVVARAKARDTGELAKLEASRVQALGVTRTMSCPVAHR